MKILVQRVKSARVEINQRIISQTNQGYLLLVSVDQGDTFETVMKMASKVLKLRIMADQHKKMNLSIIDTQGEILIVSQFTLSADARQNRPSFIRAAESKKAKKLFDHFAQELKQQIKIVKKGSFGKYMQVYIQNDGPVTIWLDSEVIL